MRPWRRLLARLVVVAVCASPALAHAALDPKAADADTRALMGADGYSFCTRPDHPLSAGARALCPLAGEIPGCTALVEECEAAPTPPPKPSAFLLQLARLLAAVAPYFAWTLVAVLLILVVYLVVRAVRAAREDVAPVQPGGPGEVTVLTEAPTPEADVSPAEALLARAGEAYARGDYRAALFTYLAASLRALDDRGAIRVERHRTNGEYLRGCREATARPPLRDLMREVDGVQFGGGEATADAARVAQSRAERIVRASADAARLAAGALMALGVVLSLGACDLQGGGAHANPAGRDLLTDLLAKQGAQISSLPGSLANLPMKGATGPVVILDADQVPLEEETREHLLAWVKQGGTLVLAGDPAQWPADLWAKSILGCGPGTTGVRVETRDAAPTAAEDDDDEEPAPRGRPVPSLAPHLHHAKLARRAAMTWPSEERAPRVLARYDDGELYGALRAFGEGRVLGLASSDLLTNIGLAVPGNAAAVIAMLATLDRSEFAVARAEQGIAPPTNPFAGLLHIGLGPALVHVALFIPLLFFAFGVRQAAPRDEPPPRRRAFAEHVQAVGALYSRRRAATHALAVYARHVDDRLRARASRGGDPAHFLAARSGADVVETAQLYARAMEARGDSAPRGDELEVLQRLSVLYGKAMSRG